MAKYSSGLLGRAYNEVGNFVTRGANKVDAKLRDSIRTAADRFSATHPGYEVHAYSGFRTTSKTAKNSRHLSGSAVDIALVDKKTGQVLDNFQSAKTFRNYEQFAQTVRAVQMEKYPELANDLRWGGYFSGNMAFDMMHIDLKPGAPMAYGSWEEGLNENGLKALPGAVSVGMNQPQLPDTMQAPLSLAQTQMRDEALAAAFSSPTRALDVLSPPSALAFAPPSRPATPTPMSAMNIMNPPQRFPGVPAGQVTRAPLDAIPASLSPAPVGRVERAPLGPVGQFAAPARSLQHPVSAPRPTQLAAAPVGQVTRGPALAPAVDMQALAAQHNQYRPSKVTQMPTVAGMPPTPAPTGLPAAPPAPATPLAHPVSVPAALPPPAPVLAPVLAPPTVVKDFPVAEVPQAPQAPRATAYDVYNGLADTALDNTGKNTVSRDAFGNTTVTNQYGVTTGMTPQGNQTAYGGLPSLPGISGPNMGKFGSAVKGALPGLAGSAVGGLLAGPLGALVGAALAKQIASPGGLLSKQNVFDTNWFGNVVTNKPQGGLGFPSAPSMPSGSRNVNGFDSRADRDHARGISPQAARDIDRGKTGLF